MYVINATLPNSFSSTIGVFKYKNTTVDVYVGQRKMMLNRYINTFELPLNSNTRPLLIHGIRDASPLYRSAFPPVETKTNCHDYGRPPNG